MSASDIIDIGNLVNKYNCMYFVEDCSNQSLLRSIIKYPFIKLYSLKSKREQVKTTLEEFRDNNRVQVYYYSHPKSFYEMVRFVPIFYPALFWLDNSFELIKKDITAISYLRILKNDVLLISSVDSQMFNYLTSIFKHSHMIAPEYSDYYVLLPKTIAIKPMDETFSADEGAEDE